MLPVECARESRLVRPGLCPRACPSFTRLSPYSHCEAALAYVATHSLGECTQEDVAELLGLSVGAVAELEAAAVGKLADGRLRDGLTEVEDEDTPELVSVVPVREVEPVATPPASGLLVDTGPGRREKRTRRRLPVVQTRGGQQAALPLGVPQ